MGSQDDKPRRQTRWALPLLALLAVFLILLGLVLVGLAQWDQIKALVHRITAPSAQGVAGSTEAWPTLGPTFTPVPSQTRSSRTPMPTLTPTAPPTPTPVVPPTFSQIKPMVEASFIQFRGTTVVEREDAKWWGKDWILLKVVGRIRVGMDLSGEASPGAVVAGNTVTLFLPHAKVTSVEILPGESEILGSRQNWLFSEYPNLDKAAWEAARQELWVAAQEEKLILSAADDLATAKLTDFCLRLGFSAVDFAWLSVRR